MAIRIRARAIATAAVWPVAGLLLAAPAGAAPDTRTHVAQTESAKAKAAPHKAADKAKAKEHAGKPKPKADPKSAAKDRPAKGEAKASKPARSGKAEPKPATVRKDSEAARAKPRPAAAARGKPALAPPVAAALQPKVPGDDVAVATPEPPASGARTKPQAIPAPAHTIITAAAMDVNAVKRAVELVRNHKQSSASEVRNSIADPVAKKLVEWVILRSDDSGADFSRYVAFINDNPNWPSIVTLRRKAEATAFQDKPDNAKVVAYFSQWPPLSAKGKFAYARALLAAGNHGAAEGLVRDAWRYDGFSQDVESRVLDTFGDFITRDDNKARMNRRLYEKDDSDAGLRAAQRLGGNEPAIAKARIAMLSKSGSRAAVEAVPAAAHGDIGYKFARIQMLRRADRLSEAVALMKTVPKLDKSHDLDEWWIERRILARKLLDAGDAKDAYLVARDATTPDSDNYQAEQQFMAGWIALRFLHDPATALTHFLKIVHTSENPISLARGSYWAGRAAEAMNRPQEARRYYIEAAHYPTAYYGQLARAKAGLGELSLRPFPPLSGSERNKAMSSDVVRAAELLYAVDARDLAWIMMADLGDKSTDVAILVVLSELAAKYRDARGMLLVGKLALARGFALDHAAFPTMGVPDYTPLGPPVDPALVYAIVRQESWFNPRTVSHANAFGLMQVTPAAGRYVAAKFKAPFDQKRLLTDMPYNVQMGAAELGDVIRDYRGSYLLAFAAYNAGRGRVREWLAKYGDPRDPKIDPVDWVERIPFSETRNYVQRVMENVQVYRVRFGGPSRLLIEADLRRGSGRE